MIRQDKKGLLKPLEETNLDCLKGVFKRLIFNSPTFCVYRFIDEAEGSISVVGDIHIDDFGPTYLLYGTFEDHKRFGIQFKILHYEIALPDDLEGIIAYLSGPLFKGIGPKKARKIVETLGSDSLDILKKDPQILSDLGFKKKDIDVIGQVLSNNLDYEDSFYKLLAIGLKASDIKRLLNKYEGNTLDILANEPFAPYFDLPNFSFNNAYKIASYYKLAHDDDRYLLALMAHLLDDLSFKTGDSIFSYQSIQNAFLKSEHDLEHFERALDLALEKGVVFLYHAYYMHFRQFWAERLISKYLLNFAKRSYVDDDLLDRCIRGIEQSIGLKYSAEQKAAIERFYHENFSLILGSPGTGKTTIVKALVSSLKDMMPYASAKIVAPTGRAAKRISELCNVEATTIHSLLKWDKEENSFEYDHNNPLLIDVLIIDEFSMVDNILFARLLDALPTLKKLCLIGDIDQLPSVNAGALLYNIYRFDQFAKTKLEVVFRQSEHSDIITLAHDIINDRVDLKNYHHDVFFHEEIADLGKSLKEIVDHYLDDGFDLNDIQVLAPMYKGASGIDHLNVLLEDIYNPLKGTQLNDRYRHFRLGDKIIQLRNQSVDDVYNGDIGNIIEIKKEGNEDYIVAKFNEQIVEYPKSEWSNLDLAYCISVHKAQGSEYPVVIFVFSCDNIHMLNRPLLYTAISRASYHLHLIGKADLFKSALKKAGRQRKSALEMMFKDDTL